ncbi:hypothetical protein HZA33_03570 [Candidatus Pacearchaeota archaeon]|nr:hypothetical protein [Candidatus Pacearchaeota archaeon]
MKKDYKKESNLGTNVLRAIVGTAFLGLLIYPKFRDAPERYVGFESYAKKGFAPVACQMQTKGDVIFVEKLEGPYIETRNKDGSITLVGNFYYQIEPDSYFAPHDEMGSDARGKTPSNPDNDYWGDVREGSVRLERRIK